MANILIYLTNHAILSALGNYFSWKNYIKCDVPQDSNPVPTCFKFSLTWVVPALSMLNDSGRYSSDLKWSRQISHLCHRCKCVNGLELEHYSDSIERTHSKWKRIITHESCYRLWLIFDRLKRQRWTCYYSKYWLKHIFRQHFTIKFYINIG